MPLFPIYLQFKYCYADIYKRFQKRELVAEMSCTVAYTKT
jgi:hypothetical protein